jgi:hypothetical protein
MGVSTDGILAYGYDLDKLFDIEDDEEKLNEILRKLYDQIPEESRTPNTDEWDWMINDDVENFYGIKIIHHGSDNYTLYLLAANSFTACRGDVEVIELPDLMNFESMNAKLKPVADILDITVRAEWMLVSWYG